ncbi:MAG: hypothetical protein WCH32_16475 [Pseudomonadota bacterium]
MHFHWKPYVPVAKRREQAERTVARLKKAGKDLTPVTAGRGAIARTFWGKAWCQNLERYSDYANRLPRGRSYLRNGSVIDLSIAAGEVAAQVLGSSLYRIQVKIAGVPAPKWQGIVQDCAQSIDSLVELLQGKFSTAVMERISRPGAGLFPSPQEIAFSCSCPDSALMCKHVAATLYGIGVRLDAEPALLFGLRKVEADELIARAGEAGPLVQRAPRASRILDTSQVADVFGIELVGSEPTTSADRARAPVRRKTAVSGKAKVKVPKRKAAKRPVRPR